VIADARLHTLRVEADGYVPLDVANVDFRFQSTIPIVLRRAPRRPIGASSVEPSTEPVNTPEVEPAPEPTPAPAPEPIEEPPPRRYPWADPFNAPR
jgi:hypothetical protein